MLDLLHAGRAIDGGGLIQLRVDRCQRGNIEDGIPAGILPNIRADEQRTEPVLLDHEVNPVAAHGGDQLVDDAVGGREEQVDHARQHHGGDEVGHVDGRLGEALEPLGVQLIQHDGQQDRDREAEEQAIHVQHDGVLEHTAAVVGVEEGLKVLQAHPLAAGDAEGSLVVAEGDLHAVHREVAENHEKDQRGNQQDPQLPVTAHGALETVSQAMAGHRTGLHLRQVDHSHVYLLLPKAVR